MRLLLDTHVLIWWDEGARLKPEASRAVRDADQVFVSSATGWEIAIKTSLGRLVTQRTVADALLENASQIATASHVRGVALDRDAVAAVEKLKAFISQARALKADHNLASRRDVRFFVTTGEVEWRVLAANLAKLTRMAGAVEISRRDKVEGAPAAVTPLGTLYLDLASTVDAGAERARLSKELEQLTKHIASTEARLSNEAFVSKAPPAVLEGARKQLADQKAKHAELERLLRALG